MKVQKERIKEKIFKLFIKAKLYDAKNKNI